MTTEHSLTRPAIDVSDLPPIEFDARSPLWWGNTLGLFIETAMFGILVAIYVTVAMNTDPFPPIRSDQLPVLRDPVPDMFLPTIGLIVLLVSLIPAIWLDVSARRRDVRSIKIGILITLSFNIAAFVIRYYEFDSLHFKWNDNAYGSITWMILGMHLLHIIILGVEDIYLTIWTYTKGVDDKHVLDLTVTAVYWYWIVGMWVLMFPLIYLTPRLI
jgi:heme/copper-type cytochrome/quinol oxidase subunit 3